MKALQFITLASPVLPVVAGIIMRYFFVRVDVAQRHHAEIIVVAGVGIVGVIDISEVAGDFDSIVGTEPQNVATIAFAGDALKPTDDGSSRDMSPCK